MLNQDICDLHDSIAVYSSYGGIVFAGEEGKNIARALGPKNKVNYFSSTFSSLPIRTSSYKPRLPYSSTTVSFPQAQLLTKPASFSGF